MDQEYVLNFFSESGSDSCFLRIFDYSHEIAKKTRKIDLQQFLDVEWNQSIPKIIDNAIMSKMSL